VSLATPCALLLSFPFNVLWFVLPQQLIRGRVGGDLAPLHVAAVVHGLAEDYGLDERAIGIIGNRV
jgi:hypothetical protein